MPVTHISSFSGGTNFSATHNETGVACGTGANRVAYVLLGRINNSTPAPTTCSVGSDALTARGAGPFTDITGRQWRLFSGALTVTGTQNVAGAWSTDDGFALMSGVILQVADSANHIADLVPGAALSSTAMELTVAAGGPGDALLLSYQNDGILVTPSAGTTAFPAQDGVNGTPAPIYFQALTEAISGAGNVVIGGTTATVAEWRAVAIRVPAAADVTPPTLSSPTGTGGALLCSGSVSTNEANGALWAVATASATAPTGVQVEAGQDHTGTAALRVVSNQAVTATGVQNIASGAVTAGTRFLHFMHEDAAGNRSAVASSGSFVVTAGGDVTPPVLTSPAGAGGAFVCSGSVSTDEANGTLFAVATASATAPTGVQVEAGQDHTGAAALRVVSQAVTATGAQTVASGAVTAGTRFLHFMHRDAAGNRSAVVSSGSFVVTAAPTFGMTFGPFALNTGAGQRAPGEAFDWWAFAGVVIGGDIDAATRRRGSGVLNASGLAVIAGLPAAGSWEVQVRFLGDAEPEKGTMRDTLTAA
jgi:hypothetical protein